MRRRIVVAVLVGVVSVLSPVASAAPVPAPLQTLGINYSGFACPASPLHAVAGFDVDLVISTRTTTPAMFEVPSRRVRVPLPSSFGELQTHVLLGRLPVGDFRYLISGSPTVGSFGGSCPGFIAVR